MIFPQKKMYGYQSSKCSH